MKKKRKSFVLICMGKQDKAQVLCQCLNLHTKIILSVNFMLETSIFNVLKLVFGGLTLILVNVCMCLVGFVIFFKFLYASYSLLHIFGCHWQVGQDVVGELTKAMERVGLDMRVAALVSLDQSYENRKELFYIFVFFFRCFQIFLFNFLGSFFPLICFGFLIFKAKSPPMVKKISTFLGS